MYTTNQKAYWMIMWWIFLLFILFVWLSFLLYNDEKKEIDNWWLTIEEQEERLTDKDIKNNSPLYVDYLNNKISKYYEEQGWWEQPIITKRVLDNIDDIRNSWAFWVEDKYWYYPIENDWWISGFSFREQKILDPKYAWVFYLWIDEEVFWSENQLNNNEDNWDWESIERWSQEDKINISY